MRNMQKVRVIPNGVDCKLFNPKVNGERIRRANGLEGKKIILFVGALTKWHRYKGLHFLLQAFKLVKKNFKDAKLLVVGEGPLRSYYEDCASSLGIAGDVLFTGEAKDEELPEFYAASDMVVLPSIDRSEGFGLTLLEGNASGKPVIGSNVGGIPEVIENGFNGLLVPPCDARHLAKTMEELCRDESLRSEMGKNGRKVAEEHDWKIIAKKTESLYFEVIKESR